MASNKHVSAMARSILQRGNSPETKVLKNRPLLCQHIAQRSIEHAVDAQVEEHMRKVSRRVDSVEAPVAVDAKISLRAQLYVLRIVRLEPVAQ